MTTSRKTRALLASIAILAATVGVPAPAGAQGVTCEFITTIINGVPSTEVICTNDDGTPIQEPEPEPTGPMCGGLEATIVGTDGNDILVGTARRDVIVALGGDDTIRGNDGNDVICAGDGRDRIDGGSGRDEIYGGRGRDFIDGGRQSDTIYGNGGIDRLLGGTGADVIDAGRGRAGRINGGNGIDTCLKGTVVRNCEA